MTAILNQKKQKYLNNPNASFMETPAYTEAVHRHLSSAVATLEHWKCKKLLADRKIKELEVQVQALETVYDGLLKKVELEQHAA